MSGESLAFSDRGEQELKGIAEPRRLFAVARGCPPRQWRVREQEMRVDLGAPPRQRRACEQEMLASANKRCAEQEEA